MRAFEATILGMLWVAGCSSRGPAELEGPADEAARAWLDLVDQGQYEASWEAANGAFRAAVAREAWGPMVAGIREPLGAVKSRKLAASRHQTTMPGAPDGDYVVLTYETSFEHKASAVETVTPGRVGDGAWQVGGYYIR